MTLTRPLILARLAVIVALFALPLTVRADSNIYISQLSPTDDSDAGGAKMAVFVKTDVIPYGDSVTEVYPFIDGHPVQVNSDDSWESLELVDGDPGVTSYWAMWGIPTTSGWHSVDALAHTANDQWTWYPDTQWVRIP